MKLIYTFVIFCGIALAQSASIISATVTVGGSGYTTVPTVTASGGGCTAEPTLTAITTANAVTGLTITFAGTGCTSAPLLAFGGPGALAAGTVALLTRPIIVLGIVNSQFSQGINPMIGAESYTSYEFVCWLTVPAARVAFYKTGTVSASLPLPGTSQVSRVNNLSTAETNAFSAGLISEYHDQFTVPVGTAIATAEGIVVSSCANQQVNINAWNPWKNYGTFFNGTAWTVVTVN